MSTVIPTSDAVVPQHAPHAHSKAGARGIADLTTGIATTAAHLRGPVEQEVSTIEPIVSFSSLYMVLASGSRLRSIILIEDKVTLDRLPRNLKNQL